jgi:hypothetical protein
VVAAAIEALFMTDMKSYLSTKWLFVMRKAEARILKSDRGISCPILTMPLNSCSLHIICSAAVTKDSLFAED